MTRGTPRPRSSTMCEPACERQPRRRVAVRDAVDEHRDAGRIGLHRQVPSVGAAGLRYDARPQSPRLRRATTATSGDPAMRRQRRDPRPRVCLRRLLRMRRPACATGTSTSLIALPAMSRAAAIVDAPLRRARRPARAAATSIAGAGSRRRSVPRGTAANARSATGGARHEWRGGARGARTATACGIAGRGAGAGATTDRHRRGGGATGGAAPVRASPRCSATGTSRARPARRRTGVLGQRVLERDLRFGRRREALARVELQRARDPVVQRVGQRLIVAAGRRARAPRSAARRRGADIPRRRSAGRAPAPAPSGRSR